MKTIKSEFVGTDARGKDWWRCIIVAESMPEVLPDTGEDVDGIPDEAGIAAGSLLLTPDGNQIYYSDDFVEPFSGSGVLAMEVSPAFTMYPSISTQCPIEAAEESDRVDVYTSGSYSEGTDYTLYVTPTADIRIAYEGEGSVPVIGEKGETIGISLVEESDYLRANFFAGDEIGGRIGVEVYVEIDWTSGGGGGAPTD